MKLKSFLVFPDCEEQLEYLSDAECGKVFRAIFAYQRSGSRPNLNERSMMVFSVFRQSLDRSREKYETIREKRSKAGKISAKLRREAREALRETQKRSEDSAGQPHTLHDVSDDTYFSDCSAEHMNDNGVGVQE